MKNDRISTAWFVSTCFVSAIACLIFAAAVPSWGQADAQQGSDVSYYEVLMQRNLFRPLGWTPPNRAPRYALILTAVAGQEEARAPNVELDFWSSIMAPEPEAKSEAPESKRVDRALIAEVGSGQVFYRSVGEKVGDMTVQLIEKGHVTLTGEGNVTTRLEFQEGGGRSSGMPSRPSGGGRSRGPQRVDRPQMPTGGPAAMPAEWRDRMERFRNMSPEERQQMRGRMRGGGGGGRGER